MRDRLLRFWARLVLDRPRLMLALLLFISLAAIAVVPGLQIEAGHSKLEDKNSIHQVRFQKFLSEFGSPNLLFALAEGGSEPLRRQLIDLLIRDLPQEGEAAKPDSRHCDPQAPPNSPFCVRDVMGRIDLDKLKSRALLYLPLGQVRTLVKTLKNESLGLRTLMNVRGLQSMITLFSAEVERRTGEPMPDAAMRKQAEMAMQVLTRFFNELARRIRDPLPSALSLEEALFPRAVQSGLDGRGYLSSLDGKFKLALIRPTNDSDEPHFVVPFVGYVRQVAEAATGRLNRQCRGPRRREVCPDGPLRVTLTGLPAIVADETDTLKRDIAFTSLIATAGILALFYFGFRSLRQTLLGLFPLATGLLWTLAMVRLAFGSLNLVTSAFIVTLLGLGIDFAVHLLSRYNEARSARASNREAVEAAIMGAGPGILTGAMTTSGAFIALAASRFLAFSQLGIITGVGLLFVLLATFTMMPILLVLPSLRFFQASARPRRAGVGSSGFDLAGMVVRRRWFFVGGGLLIAGGMLLAAQRIPWSYDYMELMPEGLDSVEAMEVLSRRSDFSAETAGVVATSLKQARTFARMLERKKSISRVESLASFLPEQQAPKIASLRELIPLVESGEPAAPEPVDLKGMDSALMALKDTMEDARFEAKRGGAEQEARLLDGPIAAVERLRRTLKEVPAAQARERLDHLQKEVTDGISRGLSILKQNLHATPVTQQVLLANLPPGLRDRLYSKGRFALYAYPSRPIWDKAFMQQLVKDLRSVSPEATGFPVTHWENSISIELGFRDASIIACIALVLLLLLDFRSLRYTLLALAPLAMGISWMWGSISLLGMSYNFVNVIAFPLIIGIGVASSVHILHRHRQEGERDIAPVVRFTGMAIFLSAATTMVGFGSLTLARHRGASSLGLVLLFGVGACLVTSVLFLPALLRVLRRRSPPDHSDRATALEVDRGR